MEMLFISSAFIYGTLFASFLTLVGYRVPINISIVNPPSHCSNCKKPLSFIDLVPIFSYLWNRGKCRNCKVRYGSFHVWMELIVGLLFTYGLIIYKENLLIYVAYLGFIILANILYVSVNVYNVFLKKISMVISFPILVISFLNFDKAYVYIFSLLLINGGLYIFKTKRSKELVILLSIIIIILFTINNFSMNSNFYFSW